jgi:hypothetical protein
MTRLGRLQKRFGHSLADFVIAAARQLFAADSSATSRFPSILSLFMRSTSKNNQTEKN